MAQMISPATCPVSSPSNRPARAEVSNGLAGYPKRDSSTITQITICSVPDFGPEVEIDRGSMTKDED